MLAAVKKFNYKGRQLAAGDVIADDLPAELERQLVEHRFARRVDPTDDQGAVRSPGSGRGRRTAKPST